ncbi:MAG TPA: hypothetical protein VH877_00345 [Polyangia bacterium]|nr:hypothetical protein [Polyangia bacterium]
MIGAHSYLRETEGVARQGETLRQQGYFSLAIEHFDKAIEQDPHDLWTRAHRGAAKASLGDFDGALADFDYVLARRDDHYWVHAQKGEALRLHLRYVVVSGAPARGFSLADFRHRLEACLAAFGKAIELMPGSAWVHAHRGATHTLGCYVEGRPGGHPETVKRYIARGEQDFRRAIELDPGYSWAFVYLACLLALHRCESGEQQPLLLRTLQFERGRRLDALQGLTEMALLERKYEEAVKRGWEMLHQDDGADTARYLIAVGLKKSGHPGAEAAIQYARARLLNLQSRTLALLGGLAAVSGDTAAAEAQLERLAEYSDMEALGFIARDPAWDSLRTSPVYRRLFGEE